MKMFSQHAPLTEAEFDRLGNFLNGCKGGKAMNVEQLDGFFAALVAGPEMVMPSEYYREVFGGEMSDTCEFGSFRRLFSGKPPRKSSLPEESKSRCRACQAYLFSLSGVSPVGLNENANTLRRHGFRKQVSLG
jgi:hypothetical protein